MPLNLPLIWIEVMNSVNNSSDDGLFRQYPKLSLGLFNLYYMLIMMMGCLDPKNTELSIF